MKRNILFLAVFVICLSISICFAEGYDSETISNVPPVSGERFVLGGIVIGNTLEDVENIYGTPDEEETGVNRGGYNFISYNYGGSVNIVFLEGANGTYFVDSLFTSADNGFATFDGVKVGMPATILKRIYGVPRILYDTDNKTKSVYRYDPNQRVGQFYFYVENGKIVRIELRRLPRGWDVKRRNS